MLHANIQSRFPSKHRSAEYAGVSSNDWSDYHWQLKNGIVTESVFLTPYYKNLDLKKCADVQKRIFRLSDNILLKTDEEISKSSVEADISEYSFEMLSVLPQRVTQDLIDQMKKDKQILIHLAINHPDECTQELMNAVSMLADNGMILNNHMTLLNGVNDSSEIVKELNLKLIMMRIRPYTITLFDVDKDKGISILESLRGWTSGLAVPHMLIKKTDGSFESVLPNYVKKSEGESFVFRNYKNMDFEYFNS